MATDNTPPRNRIILIVTVLTVVTLVVLKFVFDSYFIKSTEAEVAVKVLEKPTDELKIMRQSELKKLQEGRVPIDRAKSRLVSQGREAQPGLVPEPSGDKAAAKGWNIPVPPTE